MTDRLPIVLVAEPGLGEGLGELADRRAGHLRQGGHHLQKSIAQPPPARPPPGRRRRHVQEVARTHIAVCNTLNYSITKTVAKDCFPILASETREVNCSFSVLVSLGVTCCSICGQLWKKGEIGEGGKGRKKAAGRESAAPARARDRWSERERERKSRGLARKCGPMLWVNVCMRTRKRRVCANGIALNIVSKFILYRAPLAAISFNALGMLRLGGRK